MVTQELVDAHALRIREQVALLGDLLSHEVDAIVASVVAAAVRSLQVVDGTVIQASTNAKAMLEIQDAFASAIQVSGYYPTLLAFVSEFVDQVDEFAAFYEQMRTTSELPDMQLTDSDRDVLASQAAAAIAVLEGIPAKVTIDLQQLLARSLGESKLGELVRGLSEVIRKMAKVEPIAKDQVLLFFRIVGSLVYRDIEAGGLNLMYSYVGPTDEKVRAFCSSLMGGAYSTSQINSMDNGQVPGVFDNCGGYGCRHWWSIAGLTA